MGWFGSVGKLFGGGGDKPSGGMPALDKYSKEFQAELYRAIQSGLTGGGMTPELTARSQREALAAADRAYGDIATMGPSILRRTVPKADAGLYRYMDEEVARALARTREGIKTEHAVSRDTDRQSAIDFALQALGQEKRTGMAVAQGYNDAMMQASQIPTFFEAAAGGIGSGIGWALQRQPAQPEGTVPYYLQQDYVARSLNRDVWGGPMGFGQAFETETAFNR